MAREIVTNRQTMIDGALALIEREGKDELSARALAAELGISTQPIYREFGDMDGLKKAAIERGYQIYGEYVKGEALDQAVGYVKFAAEKSKLFDFLFRGNHYEYNGLDDMAHKLLGTDIIERLAGITGLDREKVYRLHLCIWMAVHGLASMCADNKTSVTADEIKDWVKEITQGMTGFYKIKG
ncbi:MAG: TetR/AcrR family transcriptional regulator [Clostridiales bacterium]|nr:TetR/AcrR family transcriptional regulator [Clostridiales bacterium]